MTTDAAQNPVRIIVAGVAGSGKSTVGAVLAERLGARFVDGDELHSASSVEKMSSGRPLDDADRWPWLEAIVDLAASEHRIVIACSALGRLHRDRLRRIPGVRFVFLALSQADAEARAAGRTDHFMGPAMVASQFLAMEAPGSDEADVHIVDASAALSAVIDAAVINAAVINAAGIR